MPQDQTPSGSPGDQIKDEAPLSEKEQGFVESPAPSEPLEELGRRLAGEHREVMRTGGRSPVDKVLEDHQEILKQAVGFFRSAGERDLALSIAGEWVLDNDYLIRRALRQIEEDLPASYYRELPKLQDGPFAGLPRVYSLARRFLEHEQFQAEIARLEQFIQAYQKGISLTMGELWAVPTMLRLCILQAFSQSLGRIIDTAPEKDTFPELGRLDELNPDEVVSNSIVSLRSLEYQDWKEFFEDLSLVEAFLRRDPAGVYSGMDFKTRDWYRKAVEELAVASAHVELDVAREAVRLAEEQYGGWGENPSPPTDEGPDAMLQMRERRLDFNREAHVGYYLIDKGRLKLEESLNYRPPWHKRLGRWVLARPTPVYLAGIGMPSLAIAALLVWYADSVGGGLGQVLWVAVLSFFAALNWVSQIVNWVVTQVTEPRILPKMDFEEGISPDFPAMVVIPALLTNEEVIQSLVKQLQLHYLRNPDPRLSFALLTDFGDAPDQHMEEDERLLEEIKAQIRNLNQRYHRPDAAPFFLFHRERRWNAKEGVWMGWERKRGKLHELNRLILGENETSFTVQSGDLEALSRVRYVITLDADTILPSGSAQRLVAAMAHPLNRPVFDEQTGSVVAGYNILQPRTEIDIRSANQSFFTRIFAGDAGLDLYTLAVSDVYQDLFGEGIYVGKGIYDVEAFERSLSGRVPENALLSHDLFEGIHGRVALVTDITLIEDYPPNYLAYALRNHRWVRGDWQLLPWLLTRVPSETGPKIPNRFSGISRWKIIDNLRRSLLSPLLLLFLTLGWTYLPGSPSVWTGAVVFALSGSFLTEVISSTVRIFQGDTGRQAWFSLRSTAVRLLMAIIFMPFETLSNLDAAITSLLRLTVQKRRLLQWTTAAQSASELGKHLRPEVSWRRMASAILLSLLIGVIVWVFAPQNFPMALPFLLLWIAAPQIAYWTSRTPPEFVETLTEDETLRLRALSRSTWIFFERFIGPESHWLPPDNFQEAPRGVIAHSTSPTNIGLAQLSALGAYDMGYLGLLDFSAQMNSLFESLNELQRHRGHFLNWYDTRTLEPLQPRYVSTVDSGNLAACLLALGQGAQRMENEQIPRWEMWQGLLDLILLFEELLAELENTVARDVRRELLAFLQAVSRRVTDARDKPAQWPELLQTISEEDEPEMDRLLVRLAELESEVVGADKLRRLRIYADRFRSHLHRSRREIEICMPWLFLRLHPPEMFEKPDFNAQIRERWQEIVAGLPTAARLGELDALVTRMMHQAEEFKELCRQNTDGTGQKDELANWCDDFSRRLDHAGMATKALLIGFEELHRRAQSLVEEMDFAFLFDPQRKVFHIGYNLELNRLDESHYDLLASEARIASLIAIAKGDVPQDHWLHLSRPITQVNGTRALLSWSGTMFEYLMPPLLTRGFAGTFLDHSARAMVQRQIAYGQEKNVPWGISESGYYRFDANMNYQYRAFGVPGMGFKRGLGDDLVITPYASLLALPYRPKSVVENLDRLKDYQMEGVFGLYEAVDFTEARLPINTFFKTVREYMSHHQGMIFISLVNHFKDNIMVERFHADPQVESVELLLQEQFPESAPVETPHAEESGLGVHAEREVVNHPWRERVRAPQPRAHLLSNGRYNVLITTDGSGYSSWREVDLTRWRPDATLDLWGTWVYLQDMESGKFWSAGYQPAGGKTSGLEVSFSANQAEFRRERYDISLTMEVTVPPEEDVEIRRITLVNRSDLPRRLRILSYGEVVLADRQTDERHPAFNKLFIESEILPETNMLLFRRRQRKSTEEPLFLGHFLVEEKESIEEIQYEGDRAAFIGRGSTTRSPRVLVEARPLSGSVGATLDPIFSIAKEISIEPHGTLRLAYLTLGASSRQAARSLAEHFQSWNSIERAFQQARAAAERELRRLGISSQELKAISRLYSLLIYPTEALRPPAETLAANRNGQPGLWSYGISGDYPILLVKVNRSEELPRLQKLLKAHAYWRDRRKKIDLVIINEQGRTYSGELNAQLRRLIASQNANSWLSRRGGIFLLPADEISEADRNLLYTAARVVLDGSQDISDRLQAMEHSPTRLPGFSASAPELKKKLKTEPVRRPQNLLFDNGLGGAGTDGREYLIYLEKDRWTPLPWSNVIANQDFGFLVTESGGGYTWALNSGENRLTPWSNDPVSDRPGEAVYLRDEETAEIWSPAPLPARAAEPYLVRHGAGYSIFEHNSHALEQRLRLFVAPDAPVKIIQLRIKNISDRVRRITVTYYAEWVLGVNRSHSQQFVIPEYDGESEALLARNPYNVEFGERVAFAAAGSSLHGLTADRTEFLGRNGRPERPAGLTRIGLSGTVKAGLDPCAALQIHLDLQPGESDEVHFLLGQGADRKQALQLARRFKEAGEVAAAWQSVGEFWDGILQTVQVETPDPATDFLLNRWLLYQALSCRIWGRSAFYQSSGAYGFRDQLQDVMALVYAAPGIAREHILRAARHQFEAGDVLHWWHPPSGRGVRTLIRDDLLWLPLVTAHYIEATGDIRILDERVPFKKGAPLRPEEEERYGHYEETEDTFTLYEHCRRAFEKGITAGPHGLPLMGGGDWNDGMNRVGIHGRGESVWLGWFLYAALQKFAVVCDRIQDEDQAAFYRERAGELKQALEDSAWDGEWYLRAFYDDGAPLGSKENRECQIDSIPQSWSVLSGGGDPERARRAMQAVDERLVREQDKLILLFTPPFDKTPRDPGYIKGYLPGIRENGGQYTHAALWAVWALAELGQGGRAGDLFRMLNPVYHSDSPEKRDRYKVEPYVVAADIYGVEPHVGRGGWTWYTGSSGWMYRLGLEAILGLRREDGYLVVDPTIPEDWTEYRLRYRNAGTTFDIQVENPAGVSGGVRDVFMDGERLSDGKIPLVEDGREHRVRVVLGR